MPIIDTSCRRGTSTILGTLIFVGIMMTAVIPMLLFMRQAETFHEMRKHEMEILDEERSKEDIIFYPYPMTEGSDKLNISVENRGGATVKIIRIWINDENYTLDENIQSLETRILGNFTVELKNQTSYSVKVITEKGAVFFSEAGTLYYSSSVDGWYTPSLGICVHIANIKGKYQINATIGAEEFYHYEMNSTEHGDIELMIWVDGPGSYYLTIKKDDPVLGWVDVIPRYHDEPIDVLWPATKPITDVYVSGIFA